MGSVFNLGGGELIVIAMIALLVLGPSRLPGAAKQIGKALAEFRRMSSGVQDDLRDAMNAEGVRETMSQVRDVLDVPRAIRNEVASAISSVGSTSFTGSKDELESTSSVATVSSSDRAQNPLGDTSIPSPDGIFADDLPAVLSMSDVPSPMASSADRLVLP